jgi:hypothetical protein
MKVDVETVWNMTTKEFFLNLKHMESVLAEDRYILQRQLDNKEKLKSAKTADSFGDIYNEFLQQMKAIEIVKTREMTKEEMMQAHRENLQKLGLK